MTEDQKKKKGLAVGWEETFEGFSNSRGDSNGDKAMTDFSYEVIIENNSQKRQYYKKNGSKSSDCEHDSLNKIMPNI